MMFDNPLTFLYSFNPHAREGRDRRWPTRPLRQSDVSIHTPVKGATIVFPICLGIEAVSIHTPVKGATLD